MYFVCSFANFREMDTVISERVRQFTPHALYHSQHLKVLSNHEVRMLTSACPLHSTIRKTEILFQKQMQSFKEHK